MPELTRELVEQAVAGDRRAVRKLVDALLPVIQTRVARVVLWRDTGRTHDVREEVKDLTQQVFLKLFANKGRALQQWDPKGGASLENFVGRMAEWEVLTSVRKPAWTTEVPMPLEDHDPANESLDGPEAISASKEILLKVLERVRAELTDQGRAMFEWLIVEERSVEDVCALTGMSTDAVSKWKTRLGGKVMKIAEEIMSNSVDRTRTPRTPED